MATAMGMLDRGIAQVSGSHEAGRLLLSTLQECHRQLVKVRVGASYCRRWSTCQTHSRVY